MKLQRHYVFRYCSPTRGSFLSGRLPHHDHQSNPGGESAFGPNLNMTLLPQKLKEASNRIQKLGRFVFAHKQFLCTQSKTKQTKHSAESERHVGFSQNTYE